MLDVIDTSHWNTVLSVGAFESDKLHGIIAKATEGLAFVDPKFTTFKSEAQAAGWHFGAYHFGDNADGAAQADHFLDVVKPDGATLLALDFESGMTFSQAEAFVQRVHDKVGIWPVFYTNRSLAAKVSANSVLLYCPLWLSDPDDSDKPAVPAPWKGWALWQKGTFTIPGISTVDHDLYNGTEAELAAWWTSESAVVLPPAISTPTPVPVVQTILNVPYVSQDLKGATEFRDDCGVASFLMIWKYITQKTGAPDPTLTVDQLSEETTLKVDDDGLLTSQVIDLAAKHGVKLNLVNNLTLDIIRQQISQGYPVLCLIVYGPIAGREDKGFAGGHFVDVIGYDDHSIYINDPDWADAGGHGFKVPIPQFAAAMSQMSPPNQGALVDPANFVITHPNPADYRDPVVMQVASTDGLYIRQGPSQTTERIGSLSYGALTTVYTNPVTKTSVATYVKRADGAGFVALDYLYDPRNAAPTVTAPTPAPVHAPTPKPAPIPAPPSVAIPTGKRWGLHIMPGANYAKILGTLKTLSDAKKPIKGVTLVKFSTGFDNMSVASIKDASPTTKVLLRWYDKGWEQRPIDWNTKDLTQVGKDWVQAYHDEFLRGDDFLADYHQVINEPSYGPGTATFWEGAIEKANELKIKLAVGCFANGYPDLGLIPQLAKIFSAMQSTGHIYMRHGYVLPDPGGDWTSDWTMERYRREYTALGTVIPVILGEFGTFAATKYSKEDYIAKLALAEQAMANDPVEFASLWTAGGGGTWGDSLIGDDKLDALEQYQLSS